MLVITPNGPLRVTDMVLSFWTISAASPNPPISGPPREIPCSETCAESAMMLHLPAKLGLACAIAVEPAKSTAAAVIRNWVRRIHTPGKAGGWAARVVKGGGETRQICWRGRLVATPCRGQ